MPSSRPCRTRPRPYPCGGTARGRSVPCRRLTSASPPTRISVAVVVLNWNGRDDTLACLDSLARVGSPGLDVIVVDNASSDGSEEAIRAAHREVTVIQSGANLGFAGGNNLGIVAALERGASHVMLLNNDAEVEESTISEMLDALARDRTAGAVSPLILFADPPDLVWYAGADFDPWRGRSGRVRGYRRSSGAWIDRLPRGSDRAVGAAMLFTREAIVRAGLLDDDLFFLYEDVDWSLRLRRAGMHVLFEPRALVTHKVAASQKGIEVTPTTLYYLTRNHLAVCSRHAPRGPVGGALRAMAIVAVHAGEAVRGGSRLVGIKAVLRGWRDFRRGRMGLARSARRGAAAT